MEYRKNVAAVLRRADGRIFIARRLGKNNAWQFPQGGVDEGEDLQKAVFREVAEEIGVKANFLRFVEQKGPYYYDFPLAHARKKNYRGQEQTYFLFEYLGSDRDINLYTGKPEFDDWRWILPEEFSVTWLPTFKKDVYCKVWQDFFQLDL